MTADAYIVGIGETPVGKHHGRSTLGLQAEAVIAAVTDAGLTPRDIDGLVSLGPYAGGGPLHTLGLVEYLGIRPRYEVAFDMGGTVTFMGMALHAVQTIREGRAETVVCVFGENASTRRAPGSHGFDKAAGYGTEDYEEPFGATSIVLSYAMLAQRYLDRHGLTGEQALFPVVRTMRAHASRNDNAVHRTPLTIDDYRASDYMAEPLRRLDCSPVADGAGAFVVTSAEVAKRCRHTARIEVLGVGMQSTHKVITQMPDLDRTGFVEAGADAFREAKLAPDDVDVVTVHDGFSISVLLTLEHLGFCGDGEAASWAEGGALDLGGKLPTNTHGGLLSQGHVGGALHLVEAVRQLRADAGARQVANAEVAAVVGNGGVFSVCGAMLLGRVR